ncbi:MAG: DUF554 domain-containing protein [Coriobacteriales bacterium]|nr:DUF554 domain-containing protein [Coriobacteriales bacterium]
MSGVILNILTVIVGTAIGLLFGRLIAERFREITFYAIGACTIGFGAITTVAGFTDLKATDVGSFTLLVPVISLVIGAIIGEALRFQDRLESLGTWMQGRLPKSFGKGTGKQNFVQGYMTATILFCVGAMTLLGSIQAGLGDPSTLYLKSLLDGISSIALAAAFGIGVGFAVVSILVIQGGLALLAMFFGDFFTPAIIASIDLVGGIMLIALGIEILNIKKLRVANMLPALLVAILLGWMLG